MTKTSKVSCISRTGCDTPIYCRDVGHCTRPSITNSNTQRLREAIEFLDKCRADVSSLDVGALKDAHEWFEETARSVANASDTDAVDAAKWRALRNCARITAMGSAGMERPNDADAHVTLNFWTHNDREKEAHPRQWLDIFVKKALALQGDNT